MNEKNGMKNRTCSFFYDTVKIEDFNFNTILLNKKLYENILIHEMSYKASISVKKAASHMFFLLIMEKAILIWVMINPQKKR